MISRGDVYKINLDPAIGTEVKKKRTCVVISTNRLNKWNIRFIVAPTTSKKTDKIYSFETLVKIKSTLSKVMLDQIRTVDKARFLLKEGRVTKLTEKEMREVEEKIFIVLELAKIFSNDFLLKELAKRVKVGEINWIEVFNSIGFGK
jgi:mRNA interferase MazF